MRRLNAEEVKRIQIEILDVVSSFCDEHGINYWLDSGTLLGAIRHKGYIPWDDDIDIGMLREDYDKFSELFNQSNDRYKFVDINNTKDFYVAFGKIIDTHTLLYEPDINGNKLTINIDLFSYDNAPDDNRLVKKMYSARDKYWTIAFFSRGDNVLKTDSLARRFVKRFLHFLFSSFSTEKYLKKEISNAKRYKDIKTERVGNFTCFAKFTCNKKIFDSFITVDFEGKKYKAPVGYDVWLKAIYGNYMQLPPVEKQVTHHQYEAYALEKDELSENACFIGLR